MLKPEYTPTFERDIKRLKKAHCDLEPLKDVIRLILNNDLQSIEELKQRHNMHTLSGKWRGSNECHVCNAGDWLLIWRTVADLAVFQRTGTHDQLFR